MPLLWDFEIDFAGDCIVLVLSWRHVSRAFLSVSCLRSRECAALTLDWCPRLCRACLKEKYLCVQLRGGLCVLCVWHCLVSAVLYGPSTSTRDRARHFLGRLAMRMRVSVGISFALGSILHTAACLSRGLMATGTAYSETLRRCALRPKYHIRHRTKVASL